MTKLRNLSTDQIKKFVWIFYSVWIIGLGMPWTRTVFSYLIPFGFLIAFVVLIVTDRSDQKLFLPFAGLIFILGFVIEVVGVKTGIIFGDFSFGRTLGIRILGTPLIIGGIWLMLVYCSTVIVSTFTTNTYFISFLATVLMVVFDMVLEGPAGILDMWNWDWANVPMQNFLAWFIISWILNGILQFRKIKLYNPIAGTVFTAQFIFFLFLNLVFFIEQSTN